MQQVKHAHALTTSLWTISGEIEDRYGLVFYPTYDSFFNLFLINFIITLILSPISGMSSRAARANGDRERGSTWSATRWQCLTIFAEISKENHCTHPMHISDHCSHSSDPPLPAPYSHTMVSLLTSHQHTPYTYTFMHHSVFARKHNLTTESCSKANSNPLV